MTETFRPEAGISALRDFGVPRGSATWGLCESRFPVRAHNLGFVHREAGLIDKVLE